MKKATRAEDERLLAMLVLRCTRSSGEIAKQFGLTPEYVRTAINRVKADDVAQAKAGRRECPAAVAVHYDWTVK